MKQALKDYCVGCGLCKACSKANLKVDKRGFYYPDDGDEAWLTNICPAMHPRINEYDNSSIWGKRIAVYYGWSNDVTIREKASSGGMISEIAMFLLNSKRVDAIIHTGVDPVDQTRNIATLSCTIDEVIEKCGSRYSISHPLEIINSLDKNKRYAFIGKPCDIVALRNYMDKNPQASDIILYLISFFCMGLPSVNAQYRLLNALNTDKDKCASLSYRGNGWPGFTTSVNKDGSKTNIEYSISWGKILGRDVMKSCKLCIDGIGEAADISCADAWYIKDGKPDFSEREGRNAVFARTVRGNDLLQELKNNNRITLEEMEKEEEYLRIIQWSQLYRRATLFSRISALFFMIKPYPRYPIKFIRMYGKNVSYKDKMQAFLGTCKRIAKGNL